MRETLLCAPLFPQVVEDFGLLSFLPLEVESAESMKRLVAVADKANGYYHIPPTMA